MSSIPNNVLKKNNTKGIKPKRKSIPININTNPTPDKFLISNHANNIASSYLSMGRRFQINKNIKASKVIHVNTNSASNYYTLNSKDTKQTNGSITSSILNSLKNNNRSEINSININNYININNNNYSLPQNSEIKRANIVNSKEHSVVYGSVKVELETTTVKTAQAPRLRIVGTSNSGVTVGLKADKMTLRDLDDSKLVELTNLLCAFPVPITGYGGEDKAQVSSGGFKLSKLDDNMQVKSCPGLYIVGEAVNVNGICGGYNLQWAWSSAAAAAKGVASDV